jgi:Protein of unknown function (DUF3485)
MSRYVPVVLGVLVIVGLTIPQIVMSDRFAESNVSAEQFSELLKNVPVNIGDWQGEDLETAEQVRKTAGAVGRYVNRSYHNVRTGEQVKLWLICGHARDITRHTPDVCYPSSGFTERADENSLYPFSYSDGKVAEFWTNTFTREDDTGRHIERVFWSWYRPEDGEPVRWEAPEHSRLAFGNSRALYKMYFTNQMRDPAETTEESPCIRFAREVLPVVDKALARQHEASQSAVKETAPAA